MIASSFLYLPPLLALAHANSVPTCLDSPPPPQSLPGIDDCLRLNKAIREYSRSFGNIPQIWAHGPQEPGRGVSLPHAFTITQGNDCEVLVDTAYDGATDTFPIREIAVVTRILVSECLAGMDRGYPTLGHMLAGPGQRILVSLRRYDGSHVVTEKNNTALVFNGTELTIMGATLDSGANLTSTG